MGTAQRAARACNAHDDMSYMNDMVASHMSVQCAREYLAFVRSCQHFQVHLKKPAEP